MNVQLPLTDDAIRAAIARRAASAGERDLMERVLAATAAVPQRRAWRARLEQLLAPPERRTALTLAVAVLLLMAAAIGVALVGGQVERTTLAPLGRLAYVAGGDLYVAGPAGESPRLVWDVPATDNVATRQLTWLDPKTVLMQTYDQPGAGVHVVDVTTGENRILNAGQFVALSPDRRVVAVEPFEPGATPDRRVLLIDIASGGGVGEIGGPILGYPANWSPDGRFLLGETPDTIVRIELSTGERTTLATGLCCGLSPHWPTWSPDGLRVVYVDYHEKATTDECEDRCGTVWAVAASGGEPARLTPELGSEILPAVSPDGRWIAYIDESTRQLVLTASDGSRPRVVGPGPFHGGPDGLGPVFYPQFSWDPDSAGITYLSPTATLWHVTLAGLATRIEAPAISEFARQVPP